MSRKSAPPRRVSSDTGRTCAERGRSERASARAHGATRARAAGGKKGRWRHGTKQPGHGGPLSQRRRGGRSPPAPEGRGRSARGAVEGARAVPRGRAPDGGRGERATRRPGRRVESRDTRTHATERARTAATTAGRAPERQLGRALSERGRAARERPLAPTRNDAAAAAAGRRRRARSGEPRRTREATRDRGARPPRRRRGKADTTGQADKAEETRRPPPGSEARRGERRGGDGLWGGRGTGATARRKSRTLRWARKNRREGQDREGESFRRIGTTRGLTVREAPPQAHGRSRGNPRNADWLLPARNNLQPTSRRCQAPPPTGRRPPRL